MQCNYHNSNGHSWNHRHYSHITHSIELTKNGQMRLIDADSTHNCGGVDDFK